MKEIISCSRRTDIPAFYYEWLQECLGDKKAELINSYNQEKYTVDLSPENVHSIVLWSKNFQHVLKEPKLLNNYNLFFQFTINGYSSFLEPTVPQLHLTIRQMESLCEKYSPDQINWRFDPIIFSKQGENDETEPCEEARFIVFRFLCSHFSSFGIKRCTISHVDLYGKVLERFKEKGFVFKDIDEAAKIESTKKLVAIAKDFGIQLYSCSEPLIEHVDGIQKGHCIDGEILESLFGERASKAKDAGQRKACGCSKSKDIGSYAQVCRHKCLYCYARIA